MGGAIPGQVALGRVRKADERAGGNKPVEPHSSVVSASVPAVRFLPCISAWAALGAGPSLSVSVSSLQKGDKLEEQPLIL